MPKIVDHNDRKEKIAEAAWRIIRRDGLDHVSVRRVAEEAGVSLGSLRHYFDSQDELIAFSMRLLSSRVNERIVKLPFTGDPRHDMMLVIAELVPLDELRLAESEIWLAFAGKAVSNAAIRSLSLEVHQELYTGFRRTIEQLIRHRLTRDGIDADLETRRLHALIDGLVVHHTTFRDLLTRDELMSTISYHLDNVLLKQ
ncbi:TetR/AcrR family transcriptional regulator [Cohnella cholangitidis]|uniref:TetR family transcriptional regulator n=1 Tax=Cohnella cholangitidis TaxID=2598458 RepID=A0A7G5BZR1_9BACL|nr:TetR/AcrR family transcriptional regulator [Cohnella cholangitidis]QMV42445.1 TetR family transcriptional regulator [Cohnella cholangitidis]